MYLGLRDIRAAKGRFALIAGVVGLITLLLVMLTGLTGGLGAQNTSGLKALGADRIAFGPDGSSSTGSGDVEVSFASSQITRDRAEQWSRIPGVSAAEPVGISQTRIDAGSSGSVAVFGVRQDSPLVDEAAGAATSGTAAVGPGQAVLSASAAKDFGAKTGDRISLGGREVQVAGVVPTLSYSHTPVVWTSTADWQALAHVGTQGGAAVEGTVLAVRGSLSGQAWDDAAASTGTRAATVRESLSGLPAYSSERGSLVTMQGFLYGISALVTVSFLTVWTIQRTRDIAVLRALGAGTGYLVRDAVGQAAIVLAAGVLVGAGLAAAAGALLEGSGAAVPFLLTLPSTAGPAAGIWVLGILGSLLAVRRVARVDPLIALGGN